MDLFKRAKKAWLNCMAVLNLTATDVLVLTALALRGMESLTLESRLRAMLPKKRADPKARPNPKAKAAAPKAGAPTPAPAVRRVGKQAAS